MKCTPHSESRRQLMRDYLLAEAWHTPHHNLQLVQFTVMCWLDMPPPFPRLPHKHHTNIMKNVLYHLFYFGKTTSKKTTKDSLFFIVKLFG